MFRVKLSEVSGGRRGQLRIRHYLSQSTPRTQRERRGDIPVPHYLKIGGWKTPSPLNHSLRFLRSFAAISPSVKSVVSPFVSFVLFVVPSSSLKDNAEAPDGWILVVGIVFEIHHLESFNLKLEDIRS